MPGTHYYEILRWPVVTFVELFNIPDFAEVAQNPVVVTTQTLKPNWFQSGFPFYQGFDPRHFILTLSTLGSLVRVEIENIELIRLLCWLSTIKYFMLGTLYGHFPSFDACLWENFKEPLLGSPKHETLSISQGVVMKDPGYCYQVLIWKNLFVVSIEYASLSDYICHFLSLSLPLPLPLPSFLLLFLPSFLLCACFRKLVPGTAITQCTDGCLHFADEETEIQRDLGTYPSSPS